MPHLETDGTLVTKNLHASQLVFEPYGCVDECLPRRGSRDIAA